jgi:hypothetical protein
MRVPAKLQQRCPFVPVLRKTLLRVRRTRIFLCDRVGAQAAAVTAIAVPATILANAASPAPHASPPGVNVVLC